jgi:chromosomal replication initiation ATPase DnaA
MGELPKVKPATLISVQPCVTITIDDHAYQLPLQSAVDLCDQLHAFIQANSSRDDFDVVITATCSEFNLTPKTLRNSRKRTVCDARWLVWLILRRERKTTLRALGDLFGHKHANVIHGLKRAADLIEIDPKFKAAYERISERIGPNF